MALEQRRDAVAATKERDGVLRDYFERHTNPPVFFVSAAVVVVFVATGALLPARFGTAATAVQDFIATYFGWFYILAVTFFLAFVLWLMFSRYGKIKLGPDDSKPEFRNVAWFAMLFTAGMGIGLVYFGVAEPVTHFLNPPVGEGGTQQAALEAMNLTFFHWLLHPWAVYIVLGLALGYATYRKDLPMRPASIFYPLIGDRIHGPIGHTVDVLAVFGTVFGLATSLGIGATQIGAGLETLFGVSNGIGLQLLLIAAITAVAVTSLMLGIDKGIRRLSEINMWLAVGLTAFVFVVGPTLFILTSLADNVGYYLQNLLVTSFTMFSFNEAGREWQGSWTLFYWGWWISWSPFVGMFIARISRGRTIREFCAGVLFAPVGASVVWFTVFGGSALRLILQGDAGGLAEASSENALFVLMDQLPVAGILSTVASAVGILVVVLFFATSSDSGSLVVDMLTNGGDPNPVWQQRLFWAVTEGVVAMVLLGAGALSGQNPLSALQTASITAGLPFAVVLLFMCYGLVKALQGEQLPAVVTRAERGMARSPRTAAAGTATTVNPATQHRS